MRKEAPMLQFKNLRKREKNLSRDMKCKERNLNSGPPEYQSGLLLTLFISQAALHINRLHRW